MNIANKNYDSDNYEHQFNDLVKPIPKNNEPIMVEPERDVPGINARH